MIPGESSISVGGIQDRAEKLEVAEKAEADKAAAAAEPTAEAKAAADKKAADDKAAADKAAAEAGGDKTKPLPNDPVELRKWNTKVSMELADVKKQLQLVADALAKSSKKPVDWKALAKDPEKLEKAIEAYNNQNVEELTQKHNETTVQWTARYTKAENQRRMHDPSYPRWQELQPFIVNYAAKADSRIDFERDPNEVMDAMYELAQKDSAADPNYKAPAAKPAANPDAKYTEVELTAKIKEAVDKAVAEAQKGLAAEENGAGVGGMGKGAGKGGAGDSIKKAAHAMPLNALKNAIQEATERLQK